MNTYLLWCRFEKMRGHLDEAGYRREIGIARDTVAAIGEPHWQEYLAAWPVEEARVREGSSASSLAAAGAPAVEESPPAVEAAPVAIVETTTETTTTETTIYIDSSSIRA